jgi:glycosyltransferase involved in cell wall biosynthesis
MKPENTTTKVSIIVPTCNQAQYLAACLDSIYFQDYSNIEIIIVYDKSDDNTEDIIASYRESILTDKVSFASNYNDQIDTVERTYTYRYRQDGRELRVIFNEVNKGSTYAYNIGFRAASGAYCTYVASDDVCHPQMISTMVEALERERVDFVYSDMFIIDDFGHILREFRLPDYDFEACFCRWYLLGVSKLYRRRLHHDYGFYDESYFANDHECYLRFTMNGVTFKHIPKVLYSVRSHENRKVGLHSRSNWQRLLKESCELVQKARTHHRQT